MPEHVSLVKCLSSPKIAGTDIYPRLFQREKNENLGKAAI